MPELCFVLGCEALSRAVTRERAMTGILSKAHQAGTRVVTSSMTLIEAYHGRIRRAEWNWAMSRIVVEPVTKDVADEAIALLSGTGLHGHKYATDAALAVIAGRQRGRVAVLTPDEDDMRKLCRPEVLVRAL
ncbi:MAG TPA: PIN domain-containing protein [Streptomyces sp.]|uniref:PIN domain-containing protein n=1 Tax=Streptomyces sp. TaxID=1931 RepID=UPI002BE46672|nr:PIN domain-containing protein [Streptomyces sp.]HWU07098.1 PIN domain-containing protein [Streptomyces sp.]